jgi:non-specific serine/threonine protein kinase
MPDQRAEVATAVWRGEVVVVGGFTGRGTASRRVDAYDPARNRWRRLPDLPVGVHHPMAAALNGRLYVFGGYSGGFGEPTSGAYVLASRTSRRWQRLPALPEPRAAAGAAVVGNRIVVAGGIGPNGLAQVALLYDPARRTWTRVPGPTPREHLGVAGARGRAYAVAGRTGGIDRNLTIVEEWAPGRSSWTRLADVPDPRGGTGAAVVRGRTLVSIGGEEPEGTIREVYALDLQTGVWRRLADLPTPRHGLAVAAVGDHVYAVAGGTVPGLSVTGTNERLRVAAG